ncbi:hypothetical protein ACFOSC_26655 [Streptantibioticus rubrisoli]|uniref:DUF5753 domain-containing protein n=1 Tax=Streptantibioticus rubrisoli TaxID=1387313 RepID=A0ABT1PET4_9ACTN|nr:hypothetical protein [Streptantibioticus rubrisoli]MCQ4043844.1 hypothetical protein [Streptantibioticus rubrisoli]
MATTPQLATHEIAISLSAENTTDPDTGRECLIATMDGGMPEETTSTGLRAMLIEARLLLDQVEHLAARYEAIENLRALVAEHDAEIVEMPPNMVAEFGQRAIWSGYVDGRPYLVIPQGLDPGHTLAVTRELLHKIHERRQNRGQA